MTENEDVNDVFSVGLAMGRIPKHEIMINCCIPILEMAVFPARL